jgi:hypothetical protein
LLSLLELAKPVPVHEQIDLYNGFAWFEHIHSVHVVVAWFLVGMQKLQIAFVRVYLMDHP